MLNGKELGRAIEEAFKLKKASGVISSTADVARHFGIRTPSVYDWFKKGSIGKEKLPKLFRFFSDVVGHDHWGMSKEEWPIGLSGQDDEPTPDQEKHPPAIAIKPPSRHEKRIAEIVALLRQTDMEGLAVILDRAKDAARDYPIVKQTPSSSQ